MCRFDYQTELAKAIAYRDAEVPFQLYNHPEVDEITHKWADPKYMERRFGSGRYRCESSNPGGDANYGPNHFMYTSGRTTKGWESPIGHVKLSFREWYEKAQKADNISHDVHDSRFYFRASANSERDSEGGFLFKELTFFRPPKKSNVIFKDPKGQRGIHCRFGMRGLIAEAHWDGSRNMIAQLGGRRRYILVAPEDSCDMYLLGRNHPSGRHSAVDWSKPESWADYPDFPTMPAHEVVQEPGDMLYLPTFYLHYINSIDTNYQVRSAPSSGTATNTRPRSLTYYSPPSPPRLLYLSKRPQCNTRSGRSNGGTKAIHHCTPGFDSKSVGEPNERGQSDRHAHGKLSD